MPDFVIRPQGQYAAGLPAIATPPVPTVHWARWITAAVVLVLAAGIAAVVYRNEIRDRLPTEWRTMLGSGVAGGLAASSAEARSAPPRLEIDMAASKVEFVDGRYRVRGELVNPGAREASITTIKLVFRKGEDVLGERVYPLVEGPVAPGGRQAFSRALDDPPEGTTNVVPSVE